MVAVSNSVLLRKKLRFLVPRVQVQSNLNSNQTKLLPWKPVKFHTDLIPSKYLVGKVNHIQAYLMSLAKMIKFMGNGMD